MSRTQKSVLTQTAPTATPSPPPCSAEPVKQIRASLSSLTVGIGAQYTGTFTVCTQYFSKFTASVADSTIASASVAQSMPVNDQIYMATVTITGLTYGSTTVTIMDKKGNKLIVSITVPGPVSLNCPQNWAVGGTAQCSVASNPGYTGSYQIASVSSNNCSATMTDAVAGKFTVTDTTAESCKVTVQPAPANGETQNATIVFVGPLTLNCPQSGVVNTNAQCSVAGNPGYTGKYAIFSVSSATCSANMTDATAGTFTVTDTTIESCTVTVAASPANGESAQSTIQFTGQKIFAYTGAMQSFTVPSGIAQITITVLGAQGDAGTCLGTAGKGASVAATFGVGTGQALSAGETLYVYVGGGGGSGFNGGAGGTTQGFGGGASDVRTSNSATLTGNTASDPRIIVAGGGGSTGCFSVKGGDGGAVGASGGNGANSGVGGGGGGGGTPTGPGAGGTSNNGAPGDPGTAGAGGSNAAVDDGNGGGGWFGGGGGGDGTGGHGGGGGGSSFTASSATNVSSTAGAVNGNGQITFSWHT